MYVYLSLTTWNGTSPEHFAIHGCLEAERTYLAPVISGQRDMRQPGREQKKAMTICNAVKNKFTN